MKKLLTVLATLALLLTAIPVNLGTASAEGDVPESLKILCIGNSFAVDTMEYVADIATSLGVKTVKLGTLYIGGCSINRHYSNAVNNTAAYEYYVNTGDGWTITYNHAIRATIQSEDWDWISIQHGTGDGSRYAEEASYNNLPNLINFVRSYAPADTKIAFNMTWVGERGSHEELINAFGNDTLAYYNAIAALTRDLIVPMDGIDAVAPTGTAIQNARTADVGILTRDNYHLSLLTGRYIAGLNFFKTLTGADISDITWYPPNMSRYARDVAVEAVNNAAATPFAVTASVLEMPDFSWPTNITYGDAATPSSPHHNHAAKVAPRVSKKVDLFPYLNDGGSLLPTISATTHTANGLGVQIDLTETPYLYYSFLVPDGADFTFAIYSDSTYSPWFTFLDASKGGAVLTEGAEAWDAAMSGRRQYAVTSQTGCIDMRRYLTSDVMRWIISQMRFYASKDGSEIILSYLFFGSAGENIPYAESGENLLPASTSQLVQVDGQADGAILADGSLSLTRAATSAVAWPSVRIYCNKLIDLADTPYLHLRMTPGDGAANGYLNFTYADGAGGKVQLSQLVKGTNVDFTQPLDVYVDLAEALDTTEVITLDNYSLSVYGAGGADIVWHDFTLESTKALAGDVNGDGVVSTADAAMIFRHILGNTLLDDTTLQAGDYDRNGTVSSTDVRRILKDIVNA